MDDSANAALRATLVAVAARADIAGAPDAIRQRVFAAVDELKSMGWPVERIIVRVKQVATEVGLRTSRAGHRTTRSAGDDGAIVDDVVRWCIERYFGQDATRS